MKPFFSLASILLLTATAFAQPAERPTAMRLFPTETAFFVRTNDVRLLRERFLATQGGKMLQDPEVSPLIDNLYAEADRLYTENASEKVGVGLGDILRLAQGEVALGVVARPRQRPEIMLLVDCGDEFGVAEKLLAKMEESAEALDIKVAREQLTADEALVVRPANDQNRMVGLVRRGNVFLVSTNKDLLESALARWDGRPVPPPTEPPTTPAGAKNPPPPLFQTSLAENERFAAIMQEVLVERREPPQLLGFVAPIELIRSIFAKNTGATIALATLPALGLDGLHGIGGASWYATEEWDGLTRAHLLLENPRAGVLKVVRFEQGDYTPPTWVAASNESLITTFVNTPRMLDDICLVVDKFRHEGYLREAIAGNISKNIGIDFEQEFLLGLAGRIDIATGYTDNPQLWRGGAVRGFSLTDPAAMQGTLDKLAAKFPNEMRPASHGEVNYFRLGPDRSQEEPPEENREEWERRQERRRLFTPAAGIVGDSLLVTETEELLHYAIAAHQGTAPRLADAIGYKLIASRIERLAAGQQSAGALYTDPSVGARHWLAVADSSELQELLERNITEDEDSPWKSSLRDALGGASLPSDETVLKYLAPSGGVVYDTDNGFHIILFSFRREE